MTGISEFSSQYYVLDTNLINYTGDEVVASNEFYDSLLTYVSHPVVHLDAGHHYLKPESAVPADTIAAPADIEIKDSNPILLAKDGADVPLQ